MKAIQTGTTFRIYDDSMQTHDKLPAQAYSVHFDQMSGPFLKKYSDIKINEKIYGVHIAKVNKVLTAFSNFQRNLGVILSGDKGIGKSLFSKILASEAIKRNIPLLIVNSYFPGIADYLNEIDQEVIVLFDEFDKTFRENKEQTEMLTLFDGISQGKKLFVITCNELGSLNNYLVNRPGRFHYHFRFEYPTAAEIEEYLKDKIDETYYCEIDKVIGFSKKVNLNYDCLRAIAFELQSGLPFEDAILDLNILNIHRERYTVALTFENGIKLKSSEVMIDMFDDTEYHVSFEDPDTGYDLFHVSFTPSDNKWSTEVGACAIFKKDFTATLDKYIESKSYEDDDEYSSGKNPFKELYATYKDAKPMYLTFHRKFAKGVHYAV